MEHNTARCYTASCKRDQTARFPSSADLMHGYQFATLRAQYCILAGIGRSIIPQDTGTSLIRLNAPDAVANFDAERRVCSYIPREGGGWRVDCVYRGVGWDASFRVSRVLKGGTHP